MRFRLALGMVLFLASLCAYAIVSNFRECRTQFSVLYCTSNVLMR